MLTHVCISLIPMVTITQHVITITKTSGGLFGSTDGDTLQTAETFHTGWLSAKHTENQAFWLLFSKSHHLPRAMVRDGLTDEFGLQLMPLTFMLGHKTSLALLCRISGSPMPGQSSSLLKSCHAVVPSDHVVSLLGPVVYSLAG